MPDAIGSDLVARAQRGDVDAVGALYDQHHEGIFRYVWSRVGDRHLAEDLTGDVFLHMLSGLPQYRPMGLPFRAWLFRIARNRLVDHYRKESSRAQVPLREAEQQDQLEGDPLSMTEQHLSLEQLRRALPNLDLAQREVLALRFLSGLSLQETALALGKTEAAVKALQHRGLAALRLALTQANQ